MSRQMLCRLALSKSIATIPGRRLGTFAATFTRHNQNYNHHRQQLILLATRTTTTTSQLTSQSYRSIFSMSGCLRNVESVQLSDDTTSEEGRPVKTASQVMQRLERAFASFEERCQRLEKVNEINFVRTFDNYTRAVENLEALGPIGEDDKVNLAVLSGVLMRCCGRLMPDTPAKAREMLAGNLWQFVKEKKIPLDTSLYNSLIKVLNENHTAVEPQTLLDEMKAANILPDRVTYQRLIHQYCVQGNVTSATSLLEEMKEKNLELNEATFASLIIGYSMQENPPSVNEMFELMRTNGIEPSSPSYSAAIQSQARLLKKDDPKAAEELANILQMIKDQDIQFSVHEFSDIVAELTPSKDNEVVASIMEHITKSTSLNYNSQNRLLSVLIESGNFDDASNHFWSKEVTTRARNSGRYGNSYIRLLATSKNVPPEHAIAECSRMIASNVNLNAYHQLYYLAASAGNLQLVRASLMRIGETETLKCHYFWPLLAQAKDNDEIIAVLKNDFNPEMNPSGLLETFSDWVWPKFADSPNELMKHNKELKYDEGLLIASYLDYCVGNNKIMEAVKFISELPAKELSEQQQQPGDEARNDEDVSEHDDTDEHMLTQSRSPRFDRSNLIGRLLTQICEQTKDPAMVDKAFALCLNPGAKINSRVLTPLVKVRLDQSEDYSTALECFLGIAEKYNLTPCKFDLMIRCLDKKDSENLQKIMDVSSRIYGEANTLFDLACACIRSGKMKQANKVLSSPGFRVHSSRVYTACRSLFKQQKLDILENYVFATKDLPEVNHDYLYDILLEAYDRSGNQKRALDLWNKMQEEDFQPNRKTLVHIARVLSNKNIPVPFQIPRSYSQDD